MEGWAGASVRLTDNTQQLQRGSLWRPKPAWEAHPPALEKWAEATGSDSPDLEKREAEGGAGRRRLKSGEVCAQLTAGREGAGKVSLLDFGEVGIKHGDKAVCLLAYNTSWG